MLPSVPFTVNFGACRKCHTFSLVDETQPKREEKWDNAVVPNAAQGMSRGLAPKLVPQLLLTNEKCEKDKTIENGKPSTP